jgi:hypothetical protein
VSNTLQSRLPPALRPAGITTRAAADRYLVETYLPEHNARFNVPSDRIQSVTIAHTLAHHSWVAVPMPEPPAAALVTAGQRCGGKRGACGRGRRSRRPQRCAREGVAGLERRPSDLQARALHGLCGSRPGLRRKDARSSAGSWRRGQQGARRSRLGKVRSHPLDQLDKAARPPAQPYAENCDWRPADAGGRRAAAPSSGRPPSRGHPR